MSRSGILVKSSNGSSLVKKERLNSGYRWTYERQCDRCSKVYSYDNDDIKNIFTSKYCSECSAIVKREQTKERVRRYRERQKASLKEPKSL